MYLPLTQLFTAQGARPLDTPTRLLAGALAGITSVCTTYPLDLVRSRLSIASASLSLPTAPTSSTSVMTSTARPALSYHTAATATRSSVVLGIWGMTLKVMREEGGVRGLYRGLVATAVGVAPYVGLNFAAYEALRGFVTPPGKSTVPRKLTCGALAGEPHEFTPEILFADAPIGSISQTLTYPFDVLRRKMQVVGMSQSVLGYKYNGAFEALRVIIRTEGILGLYRGLWPNLRRFHLSVLAVVADWTLHLVKVAPSIATS